MNLGLSPEVRAEQLMTLTETSALEIERRNEEEWGRQRELQRGREKGENRGDHSDEREK